MATTPLRADSAHANLNRIRTIDKVSEPVARVAALLHAVDAAKDERHVAYLIDMAGEEIARAEYALREHATEPHHA